MTELVNAFPPGWDCKYDEKAGKYYFINHYTRTTTWEDPRNRHVGFSASPKHSIKMPAEYIPLQHGSPEFKRNSVYPSWFPPIPAFQMNSKSVPIQEVRSTRSPFTLRSAKVQDSSFTTISSQSSSDTEDSVVKISAMFPTVSETHIKLLLKKYMKSIFANADETLILECLQNNDNSIQKASEILREMGYSKKETVKVSSPNLRAKGLENSIDNMEQKTIPSVIPRCKTAEEKDQMKIKLQEQYSDVPEHLILIALESVNFNEDRANKILNIMKQEDSETEHKNKKKDESYSGVDAAPSTNQYMPQIPISQSRQSIKSLLKSEKKEVSSFSRIIDQNVEYFKSSNLSNTAGHNPELSKGPNEKLLLENYVQWQGSSKALHKGPQKISKGHNESLLSSKLYSPCGPNLELRKGPSLGLAKGSIFSHFKTVVLGETTVK